MNTDRIEPHVWRIAAVVVIGAILSILDTTIVNVALDTLGRDLHSPLADIQWVATGYMLALAAVIPVSGWAAGRFGAKRLCTRLGGPLHARLGPLRPRVVDRDARHLPRPPGHRRRHAHARRHDDAGTRAAGPAAWAGSWPSSGCR